MLDKTPAPNPAPRYGVTFEDHVIPAERALGLASSTVKVIDLKTGEVLGEMLRYAWGVIGRDPSEVRGSRHTNAPVMLLGECRNAEIC
ncbi:MAG: hypothetical protein IPG34_12730 [Rhodocyclaceae bacterium]|nr:hypothetical protein [Rhodocyclaceae bacterium]